MWIEKVSSWCRQTFRLFIIHFWVTRQCCEWAWHTAGTERRSGVHCSSRCIWWTIVTNERHSKKKSWETFETFFCLCVLEMFFISNIRHKKVKKSLSRFRVLEYWLHFLHPEVIDHYFWLHTVSAYDTLPEPGSQFGEWVMCALHILQDWLQLCCWLTLKQNAPHEFIRVFLFLCRFVAFCLSASASLCEGESSRSEDFSMQDHH